MNQLGSQHPAIPLTLRKRRTTLVFLAVDLGMNSFFQRAKSLLGFLSLIALAASCFLPGSAYAQSRTAEEADFRGNRAEIALTIKDTSGQIITAPAMVKVYHSGTLSGQASASQGRAFFILSALGDYTITVDASGYKSAQKDVSLQVALRDEEDIYLQSDSASANGSGVPGKALLAPKAKEALDKGLQALKDNKLDDALKYLDEAMRLAPSHPDVLYGRAVIYLRRSEWAKAQDLLEKATQLDPKHAPALSALGMVFVDTGKFDQAVAPLQQSLAIEPTGWETHWALAKAYYHQQQYGDAVKESQEAWTESHGASPQIELLLAQSLTAVGKYEDAAQALRDFLKNHPDASGADNARRWLARLTADGKIRHD
ncbi:MAG TPA: tetratricopeptide repeat protein [Candidatus Angelobacter sp.]|nr:tetratricopeptide repeat protein [Candidatus Angelobacter sp.]